MGKLTLILLLIGLGACSRAEWQEDRGDGRLGQERSEQTPAEPGHRPPQTFDECRSQTLSVEVSTAKTRNNLKDFLTVTARYPLMKVTPASKTKKQSTFFLNAGDANKKACTDQACAENAGWSQIQNDFMDLNDVNVMCMGQPAPPTPTPTPGPTAVPTPTKVADKSSTDF